MIAAEIIDDQSFRIDHLFKLGYLRPAYAERDALDIAMRKVSDVVRPEILEWLAAFAPSGRFEPRLVRHRRKKRVVETELVLLFDDPNEAVAFRLRWM